MTPEEFVKEAEKIIKEHIGNPEAVHCRTDDLMENTLDELGYKEGVDLITKQERWYA